MVTLLIIKGLEFLENVLVSHCFDSILNKYYPQIRSNYHIFFSNLVNAIYKYIFAILIKLVSLLKIRMMLNYFYKEF